MKQIKKIQELKVQHKAVYLNDGMSLADVLKQVLADGVTDLSTVKYDQDYVGCQCDHGDSYCYCATTYTDMRFNYEVKT